MFGPNLTQGFSLTKMLSGLSRGLNFANQMIPLYQQAKPLISNARKLMGIIKEFSHYNPPKENSITPPQKNTSEAQTIATSNPVFFQ